MGSFADRQIVLESSHNFRDLGGYPTSDGRTTQWGRIYRADSLHLLSAADVEVLTKLGLRTVIDLRSAPELEHHGRDRFDEGTFGYWHVPLIDRVVIERAVEADPAAKPKDAADVYRGLLGWGANGIARCLTLLAEPGAAPAVFHCAVGKDRTGVVAALLLSSLGVADDDVAADYALTTHSWPGRERFLAEHDPVFLAYLRAIPPSFLGSAPDTMQRLLGVIRADHGSTRGYLRSIGVGDDVMARLESTLLEA